MRKLRAEDQVRVLQKLREGRSTSREIAQLVGVSEQVIMGIKSHWTRGTYGDPPRKKEPVKTMTSWTYLILSSKGEVYLGATTNLRARLRSHNSPGNKGFTKGRQWHLLAARRFATRKEAFDYEHTLKVSMSLKMEWKIRCISRAQKIVVKYGYLYEPTAWDISLKLF